VKLVAVPTVRVLAENAPADAQRVVIVLDAKREQIYTARFERGSRAENGGFGETALPVSPCWREAEPAHLDTLAAMLARSDRPVHLMGDGIPFHEKFIPREDAGVVVTPADTWRARAGVVARLGWEMAARGEFADAMKLTPIYVRLPEAEEKYLANCGQSR
jgi:tRNA threonylcarbamoyladenosine biosynthesis protein TsaB